MPEVDIKLSGQNRKHDIIVADSHNRVQSFAIVLQDCSSSKNLKSQNNSISTVLNSRLTQHARLDDNFKARKKIPYAIYSSFNIYYHRINFNWTVKNVRRIRELSGHLSVVFYVVNPSQMCHI
ncbi:hypothetical protein RF11_01248 [Thelohanellus kitauei]|uniref:Uncharacterized protein n=1 Tax=Thelohanellus kitauei TaxID=669202 RepID=A0A0C2N5M4_THEKT|nr:hypothetical protein RF11_01248 [Thelohanellus kitauei]